jgi:diguanylate cyclase (GGDEF)-like protein
MSEVEIVILKNLLKEVTKKYDELIKLKEMELEEILKEAKKDPLTDLFNRRVLDEIKPYLLKKARSHNKKVGVIFLDLDKFKEINDRYGHKKGDEILEKVANVLKNIFRKDDLLIRYGGDEFVVFSFIEDKTALINLVERAKNYLQKVDISFSYGVSIYPDDGNDVDDLLSIADKLMYKNKNGRKFVIKD